MIGLSTLFEVVLKFLDERKVRTKPNSWEEGEGGKEEEVTITKSLEEYSWKM